MQLNHELKQAAIAATSGLSHSDRESLALSLAEVIAGEPVAFLECSRGQLTAWLDPSKGEAAEMKELRSKYLRGQLDEAGQVRLAALLDRSLAGRGQYFAVRRESKPSGPVHLSDADREAIRRMGKDPDVVARMSEVHSPDDYRRIVADTRGGGR